MLKESEFSRHHKIFRALWAVFLLILGCVFSINIVQYVAHYLTYPTTQETVHIDVETMTFPAVTFCNVNKLRKSDFENSQYSDLLLLDIPGALSNLMPYEGPCFDGDFICNENGGSSECVKSYMQCNGVSECKDGEDERDCPNINEGPMDENAVCSVDTDDVFICNNSKCIPDQLRCDYIDNCGDFSDEKDCEYSIDCSVDGNTFQCEDKSEGAACVPVKYKCDRIKHCRDGSDEKNCNYKIQDSGNTRTFANGLNWTHSYRDIGAFARHFEDFRDNVYMPNTLIDVVVEESPSLIRLLLASNSPTFGDVLDNLDFNSTELQQFGYKLEDSLLKCTYNGKQCGPRDFTIFQNKRFGNCFTFNQDTRQRNKENQPGPENGLKLILSAEQDEALGILGGHSGFKVIVHDPDVLPQFETNGFPAPPAMLTSVATEKIITNLLSEPFGLCSEDISSQMECEKQCVARHVNEYCDCDVTLMGDFNSTRCDPHNATQDLCKQLMEHFVSNGIIYCDCSPPCSSSHYKTKLVQTPWPSDSYLPHLINSIRASNNKTWTMTNVLNARKNIVSIEVYIGRSGHSQVSQVVAYTTMNLLRDLGTSLAIYSSIAMITVILAYVLCGPKGETGYVNTSQTDELGEKEGVSDEGKDHDTAETTEF